MPRKLWVQDEGALYHVMSRGDRREDIFHNDVDRQDFLKTLAQACRKTDWPAHAYCLMPLPPKIVVARVRWGTSKSANARLRQWMQRPALVTTRKTPPPMNQNKPSYGLTPFLSHLMMKRHNKSPEALLHEEAEKHLAASRTSTRIWTV